jgi:acetyltransferase
MTYQIHRYPADLIDVVHLGDGERVVIRPVLPQDEDLTLAFFHGLSGSARYDRFMTSLREVPRDLMRRFTQVDYANHLALVAEVFGDGRETVVAEARYVRTGEDRSTAEFAVSVAEPWQGKGLARLMLGKLACRAGSQGVVRLTGQTLATNERMLALARKAGFTLRPSGEVRGVIELEKWLPKPQPGRICSGAGPSALAA